MEFLGVGPLELVFILIIALIVLGPKDMEKAGRTLGRLMNKVVRSPSWMTMRNVSREIRYLPNRLMREAGIEEEEMRRLLNPLGNKQPGARPNPYVPGLNVSSDEDLAAWVETTPTILPTPSEPLEGGAAEYNAPPEPPSE